MRRAAKGGMGNEVERQEEEEDEEGGREERRGDFTREVIRDADSDNVGVFRACSAPPL